MPRVAASPRLERLLSLVPWVMAHTGDGGPRCASGSRSRSEELAADLDLLFMCGLPPFGPGDLIVAYIEGDQVVIEEADYLARPLRLTRWEAVVSSSPAARSPVPACSKPTRCSVGSRSSRPRSHPRRRQPRPRLAERVAVELEGTGAEPMLADLREAIGRSSPAQDHLLLVRARRDLGAKVDPYVVFGALGNWYVSAHDVLSGSSASSASTGSRR